ncbi:MAG: hypothetical protein JO257_24725 [Deltaproteobacteria bacterium]|nr:hypothetical protein [Deltaproteobacteria bacterium]
MRGFIALAIVAATAAPAAADPNDLVLSRLGTRITDTNGMLTGVVGENLEFRELSSQLGVVLAPHLLTPADTNGFGGFQMTVDYASTTIDASAPYWRVRDGGTASSMTTIGFFARKGMWFPVPSFEVAAGAVHLVESHTWAAQLYAKLALHEGYHDLPLPSLAVRGGVSRMMNQRELDLTVASVDAIVSKHIGVGGTWRFDPYAGWNVLFIIPRSQVLDPTPNIDSTQPGQNNDSLLNFTFKDQQDIIRQRFFAGAKLQYYIFQFTLEFQYALKGSSVDDRAGTNMPCVENSTTSVCDAKDAAKAQRTLALSAGFEF